MDEKTKITIKRKFKLIEENLEKLKQYYFDYQKPKNEKYKEITFFALKRVAEEITESAIKLNIILLKTRDIFPITYKESFLKLYEFNLFDKELAKSFAKTAQFRNILAHEYQDLTELETIENIKIILKLYPTYLIKINNFIEQK